MGRIFSSWKSDCCRFIGNKRFLFSILCVTAVCIFSSSYYIFYEGKMGHTTVINILFMLFATSMDVIILSVFAAFPAVTSFCSDWNCQYIRCYISRSGTKSYIKGRIFSCFTTTFLTVFCGLILFVIILAFLFPVANMEWDINANVYAVSHKLILISPWLYIVYHIFIISLATATWGMIGLSISAVLPNRFIALLSPFICCYIVTTVTRGLPIYLNFYSINSLDDVLKQESPVLNLIYIIGLYTVIMLIFSLIFSRIVKRRVGNEIT